MRDDVKKFLKQTEKMIKEVGAKAGEIAKAVEKDAAVGTKAGMAKVEQLALENEKNKLFSKLGQKVYSLMNKKDISHKGLEETFGKIKALDNKIRGKKAAISKLKGKLKKTKSRTAGKTTSKTASKK
jgi:hypothetical protein